MLNDAVLYFDGACEPKNPGGYATYGFVVLARDGKLVAYGRGSLGKMRSSTNNVAEYAALVSGLKCCLTYRITPAKVFGDSQLVVNQVTANWRCKSSRLAKYLKRARSLFAQLDERWMETRQIPIEHIERDMNRQADALSRGALREAKERGGHCAFGRVTVKPQYLANLAADESAYDVQDGHIL